MEYQMMKMINPKIDEYNEYDELRKKIFKPKSSIGFSRSDAANTVYDPDITRKKILPSDYKI